MPFAAAFCCELVARSMMSCRAASMTYYSTSAQDPRRRDGLQPMRDLDQIRSFLSSAGPAALFDLPWMPLYVGICFFFHPLIGIAAAVGALMLVV